MKDKIPIYIIIIVIVLILIFIIVIASYQDSSEKSKPKKFQTKVINPTPWGINSNFTNTSVQKINPYRELDSTIFEFNVLNYKESYIFGGSMKNSSISVYKNDVLVYSKIFSGNCGLVLSNNLQNVNASFFQIGKKINLENIKYEYIPIKFSDETVKVAINNIELEEFKIFKCFFDYDLLSGKVLDESFASSKSKSTVSNIFSISEYDIMKDIHNKNIDSNFEDKPLTEKRLERVYPKRSFDKQHNYNWFLKESGSYVVYYVKGLYSFDILDLDNNLKLVNQDNKKSSISTRELNSIVQNLELDYFYIDNPNIAIINKDENIPEKNFNTDLIKLFNTPNELYKHFVYGKKKIPIDIWNKINNKIFVFKK